MARIQNETRQCGCTVSAKQEDGQAISNALELAKARRILLTADWAVTPEEKQLARKIIDRLTHNAAKKGFKGQ